MRQTRSAEPEEEAPGWDAINAALAPHVAGVDPLHWATGALLPDQDGVWGISAYPLPDHWLLVTYGLTELFAKVSDDPNVSGWGAELTMRVVIDGDGAPEWAVALLSRLGELVFERNVMFAPGDRLDVPSAVPPAPRGLCWAADPLLGPIDGPFGRFGFTTTVGVTADLLTDMRASTTASILDRLREVNSPLVYGGAGLPVSRPESAGT